MQSGRDVAMPEINAKKRPVAVLSCIITRMTIRMRVALVIGMLMTGFAAGNSLANTESFGIKAGDRIIDQAGRNIQVRTPFQRIISLYGAHTENLFALGLDREIIGVCPHEAYPKLAMKKPVFSYHDDPEKFLAHRPDLVLIRPMIDRGHPQLVRRLEQNAITVVSLQPATIEGMYRYWEILGILCGKQARADQMTAYFQEKIAEYSALTQQIPKKKRVYFEAIHDRMKTFSPGSIAAFALETAGGIHVAVDAEPVNGSNIAWYGKEKILSHAADIDVYLAQSGVMNRTSVDLIRNEPGFQAIKAIEEGRIFIVDEMLVSRPGARLLIGIHAIGRFLYPEVFGRNPIQQPGGGY